MVGNRSRSGLCRTEANSPQDPIVDISVVSRIPAVPESPSLNCPSCGAPHGLDLRFAAAGVCPYCQSGFVTENGSARTAGKMAVLLPSSGILALGRTYELLGKPFQLIGRLRMEFPAGAWDEWFAVSGQKTAWVAEDGDGILVQIEVPLPEADLASLGPGDSLPLQGKIFTVVERDTARSTGAEGAVPWLDQPGDAITYLEAVCEPDLVASIEIPAHGTTRAFAGRKLVIGKDLPASFRPPAPTRAALVRCVSCGASGLPGTRASDSCPSCGGTFLTPLATFACGGCGKELHAFTEAAAELHCPSCGGLSTLRDGAATYIGSGGTTGRPTFDPRLRLGVTGTLDGQRWMVVARIRQSESDDGEVEHASEYLLHDPARGYRWLLSEESGWLWQIPCDGAAPDRATIRRSPRNLTRFGQILSRSWQGTTTIDYVEGELPWNAKVGERTEYASWRNNQRTYYVEWSEKEIEHSLYRPISDDAIAAGFPRGGPSDDAGTQVFGGARHSARPYSALAHRTAVVGSLGFALFFLTRCGSGPSQTYPLLSRPGSTSTASAYVPLVEGRQEVFLSGVSREERLEYTLKVQDAGGRILCDDRSHVGTDLREAGCIVNSPRNQDGTAMVSSPTPLPASLALHSTRNPASPMAGFFAAFSLLAAAIGHFLLKRDGVPE